jgi:hypothetical protein
MTSSLSTTTLKSNTVNGSTATQSLKIENVRFSHFDTNPAHSVHASHPL